MGCGTRAPKAQLLRFAATDGELVADPGARLPGRGAYLHRDGACWEAAVAQRGFARALRTGIRLPAQSAWTLDWTT